MPAGQDFITLFCELHHCPPSEYEERAFRICLYWRARILSPLIRAIRPRFFEPDFELIRYLAKCQGRRNANNELAAFMEATDSRGNFARRVLRFRISSRKAGMLVNRVFELRADSAARGPGRAPGGAG